MEHATRADAQIDATLVNEDIDVSPEPKSQISEHKKAEIRNICKSRFGSVFMKEHAESDFANLSTLLDILQRNQFSSVDEVKREAVCFFDAQVRWFQNPSNGEMHQRNEMVLMAENLKQRFVNLVNDERSVQSTEFVIVEKLSEIFPQMDHLELHRRVNHYIDQSRNYTNRRGIDVAFAFIEIAQQISVTETDSIIQPK